jgi:hypothetical protein
MAARRSAAIHGLPLLATRGASYGVPDPRQTPFRPRNAAVSTTALPARAGGRRKAGGGTPLPAAEGPNGLPARAAASEAVRAPPAADAGPRSPPPAGRAPALPGPDPVGRSGRPPPRPSVGHARAEPRPVEVAPTPPLRRPCPPEPRPVEVPSPPTRPRAGPTPVHPHPSPAPAAFVPPPSRGRRPTPVVTDPPEGRRVRRQPPGPRNPPPERKPIHASAPPPADPAELLTYEISGFRSGTRAPPLRYFPAIEGAQAPPGRIHPGPSPRPRQ